MSSSLVTTLRAIDAYLDLEMPNKRVATQGATAATILARALLATGHADGWEADTLTGRQALDVLHAVRLEARRVLRGMAEALLAELDGRAESKALFGAAKAKVGKFFSAAGKFVKEAILAGVLAIAGPGPVSQIMEEAIERNHAVQMEYMDRFQRKIMDEDKKLDGTFVGNAEQYGGGIWGATQQAVREIVRDSLVFDQESRVHIGPRTDTDPCDTCTTEEGKGWQPIGSLRVIGDSICKSACHCSFRFRKGNDGRPHWAGRGPLKESVFGRTG